MSSRFRSSAHSYEPLPRASLDSEDLPDLERNVSNSSWLSRLGDSIPLTLLPSVKQISNPSTYARLVRPRRRKRSLLRLLYFCIFSIPFICLFLVVFFSLFLPSYTHRPPQYNELRRRSLLKTTPGRANIHNEKVFIAASIYEANGTLTSGAWGQSVLDLVDLLGPENVYLSIYENDPDPLTKRSLDELRKRTPCNSSIVYEDFDLGTLPRVSLPTGETRAKRIAFLAEVRNRALAPIDTAGVEFDRLLFINDVHFNPIDAAQLLLSTNVDTTGRASYGAACAVDFINAFKFYDRFATRDMDGYNMGIPFYPWFTSAGSATSRKDTLSGSDAVRVRSCWGGMTAFEAKWFQDLRKLHGEEPAVSKDVDTRYAVDEPLRFRFEKETFWESSECCLINADLTHLRTGQGMPAESGIYMNPFIRVAYDTRTLSWLSLTRRPEKLYSLMHDILNYFVGFPQGNPRQTEEPGETMTDTIWVYDDPKAAFASNHTSRDLNGHWEQQERIATPGGFCGGRQLLALNDKPEHGEGKWSSIRPPAPPS
ncbi:cryptococcal mannosyltransferase 1-domain-containing protein [Lophiotrema nucula]|uniref:Cryptococcal mannosyltransferase 1-domain-containing protein n=1 Tax=Lophiotrema nucula TaxID=690887 RepID=A0A6A5YIS8_9PLEO|nr:cryptococcal mannosyltransferase 1-domain-containing protein [Lophiotrema nucula]